jgi:Tol biopolymer transport system component
VYPADWGAGGKLLLTAADKNGYNVVVYDPLADEAQNFVASPFSEVHGQFSPDGRFIAYVSDDSGTFQVFVRPYPGPGSKRQISENGGLAPQWSRDGRQLYFRNVGQLLVARVDTANGFRASRPEVVFDDIPTADAEQTLFTVAPDGEWFYYPDRLETGKQETGITVVLGWLEELARRLPAD